MSNNNEYQDKPFDSIIHDGDKIDTLAQLKRKAFDLADMAFRMHSYSEINLAPVGLESRKRVFKFNHIVIKTKTRSEFNYDLFDVSKFIDATYVMDYPEDCIVLVDASRGLNADFFWYLKNRIDLLLALVNLNYNKYNDIEDCAAFRDLMTVLCFINKYSDKFVIGSTVGKFILIRCYDIPDIYFKVIPTVAYTLQKAAPKPISILDNPRYKDYGKYTCASAINPDKSKINDLDIVTLYPTKKNPLDFNPVELLRKLALDDANNDFYKKQWDLFEKTNKESVKRTIKKKKTNSTAPSKFSFDELTDEQIADNYEEILKYYVIEFNKLIDKGMPIKEVWDTGVGKSLIGFINYIFDLSTKDKFGKYINFSLTVDDNYKLQLGKYSDVNPTSANFGLMKPGNFIRKYHADEKTDEDVKDDETDSDQQ